MEFKETGNKIAVEKPELIDYCHKIMKQYNEDNNMPNPYEEPIQYTTKNNKLIVIPKEIQEEAILLLDKKPKKKEKIVREKDYSQIILFIIIGIIALYLFYKN